MNELFRRLFRSKSLAVEIIVSSFFVNLLFLASPIFVIQILSRYIGYGFDGTLYTLTGGMLIALVLSVAFGIVRTRMCSVVSAEPDRKLQALVLDALSRIKAGAFGRIPQAKVQEIVSAPLTVQSAYDAQKIASVLDMPFLLLFVLAIFFLSPLLAIITLLAIGMTVLSSWLSMKKARVGEREFRDGIVSHRSSVNSAIHGVETVRAFSGGSYLRNIWKKQIEHLNTLKEKGVLHKGWSTSLIQGVSSLLKVAVYAVGAKQVVMGDLTVGALIGVSILSAKALQISTNFMQTVLVLGKASDAMRIIEEFSTLPKESVQGTALKQYSGRLELQDVAIMFPGASGPLFESLSMTIEPGQVVGVLGANGAGKTTLAKLVVGLVEPIRGQVLIDGVEHRQLAPEWWRKQVMYLPQEPVFINGTFRDNITLLAPDISDEALNEIIRTADLRRFFDTSETGIDTQIVGGGARLPLGMRKRLALARALVANSPLAVFDEPTEGLDKDGTEAVFQVMNELVQRGATIIVVSNDPNIMKGASIVIDLNSKPVPKIGVVHKATTSSPSDQMGGQN